MLSKTLPALTLAGLMLASTATAATAPAVANLVGPTGASLGKATLTEARTGVLLKIEAKDLSPGWHGLHFHETGDCSKSDFTSAGAHVHTGATKVHGLLNPDGNEAGDLPNLYIAADGMGTAEIFAAGVSITGANGRANLMDKDGSALVVHASPDDHMSQPIGGAGARVACGMIKAP